jgi:hypothetical protein
MSEPQIVPPTPTVVVPSTGPVDNSPGLEQVQRAFDRAYPDMNPKATAAAAAAPPDAPPQPEPQPPPPPQAEPEMRKMPSFLEQQLTSEAPPKLPEPEPDADFPEDLPPEQKQSRIKGLREAYKKLKNENETLRSTPAQDDGQRQRMEALENRNKQMQAVLQRMGVEQHTEFQQQVIAPMTQAWQTAAGIVQEAGGDPEALARAVQLQGKEHFEALDEVFDELPESAKMEAHQAIAAYKRLDKVRQKALADAPKTYEALHKRDLEREYQNVNKQRAEMGNIFDDAVRTLREEAKVEVLQRSNDPDAKWWNDQADAVEGIARQLYMENTDMRKMAMAVLMAPMADVYRKLWMQERANNAKNNDMIKERYGAEPYIGSGGGNNGSPDLQMKEDLKRPFNEVFLREFHRAKARNNR